MDKDKYLDVTKKRKKKYKQKTSATRQNEFVYIDIYLGHLEYSIALFLPHTNTCTRQGIAKKKTFFVLETAKT